MAFMSVEREMYQTYTFRDVIGHIEINNWFDWVL